ncbi:MAG: serine hydrolase domain-containing protein [Pseudomonadota bacterium]
MKIPFRYIAPLCLTLALFFASAVKAQSLKKLGVSESRLARISELGDSYVDQNQYSGVVMLVAKEGKVIHSSAHGVYGIDNDKLMAEDTLFRIYSMTKPITTAAAMMLYEQGKFHLDDPISDYLPEFAEMKIQERDGSTRDAKTPITVRHLMTHTAGMTYGFTPDNPVDEAYIAANLLGSENLDVFTSSVANMPLRYEPGTRYHYSVSIDILGKLVEIWSGQDLASYFDEHIFSPLGMDETFFEVPDELADRFASDQYWDLQTEQIALVPAQQKRDFFNVGLYFGGGGLVSKATDYLKFCQMILNGGELNGVRLLSPKTVQLMTADHLTPTVRAEGVGEYPTLDLYPGQSMSFGYGVVTHPAWMPAFSSKGELSWGGVAGTKFWIDPVENIIGIAMVQLFQSPWPLRLDLQVATYQALTEIAE